MIILITTRRRCVGDQSQQLTTLRIGVKMTRHSLSSTESADERPIGITRLSDNQSESSTEDAPLALGLVAMLKSKIPALASFVVRQLSSLAWGSNDLAVLTYEDLADERPVRVVVIPDVPRTGT